MKNTLKTLVAAVFFGMFASVSSAALSGTYTLAGTTTGTGPWNMTSTDSTFAILRFVLDTPVQFQDITDLNYGYDSNLGGIGGGAPRATVVFDNGKSLVIHWGPAGTFTDATIGNNFNTGNLVALTDVGRYDLSMGGLGGSGYTDRTAALALAGTMNVVRISLVIDSFGGNNRDFDINSVSVSAVPEPSTYVAGGLLLLPFAASTLRFMRKRRTA